MNTDLDQTLTESDIEYHSQSSYALETYPVPCNFLLQIPDSVPQCLFKKPSQSTNQRCVVLFRNLIYEQVTHRFDKAENMHEDNPSVFGQFKFFLNTLEILCHYLKVIDLDDYAYRVKDYGIYKKHLIGFPHKLEAGSIVTVQTYNSVIQNEVSDVLKQKFSTFDSKGPLGKRILLCYREYAYSSAQYHLKLKAICQELSRLGGILDDISSDWRSDNSKISSTFFVEGIWHPRKKILYVSSIQQMLKNFEQSIRDFEQSLIKCTIALLDLTIEEASRYKFSYGELKSEGNSFQNPCYQTPTEETNLQKRLFTVEEYNTSRPQNLTRLFTEPSPLHKSPRFGKTRSQLNLSDAFGNHRTPNTYVTIHKAKENSGSYGQSTLPTTGKLSSRGTNKGLGVEVRPWIEAGNMVNKRKVSYMTPVDGTKFSFRNADTSVTKVIMNDPYGDVQKRSSHLIRFQSDWEGVKLMDSKGKDYGMVKKNERVVLSKINNDYNTPKIKANQELCFRKDTGGSRVSKGSEMKRGLENYIRSGEKNDQIKSLFQQSNFYKGKVGGGSSKLLKFR